MTTNVWRHLTALTTGPNQFSAVAAARMSRRPYYLDHALGCRVAPDAEPCQHAFPPDGLPSAFVIKQSDKWRSTACYRSIGGDRAREVYTRERLQAELPC